VYVIFWGFKIYPKKWFAFYIRQDIIRCFVFLSVQEGDEAFFQKSGNRLQGHTASLPTRMQSSFALL
jgi:hypothetical protein